MGNCCQSNPEHLNQPQYAPTLDLEDVVESKQEVNALMHISKINQKYGGIDISTFQDTTSSRCFMETIQDVLPSLAYCYV